MHTAVVRPPAVFNPHPDALPLTITRASGYPVDRRPNWHETWIKMEAVKTIFTQRGSP